MSAFGVDPASSVPVFEQIVNGLRYAVASGAYAPGEQLPSVRQLAVELLVNPNTVAKAYRELEREGVTYARKGLGIFVANGAARPCRTFRRRVVAERVAAALDEAARSGLDADEIEAIVRQELTRTLARTRAEEGG